MSKYKLIESMRLKVLAGHRTSPDSPGYTEYVRADDLERERADRAEVEVKRLEQKTYALDDIILAEVKRLRESALGWQSACTVADAERDRYRAALERIASCNVFGEDVPPFAREALKNE
jgi:hypothetical protein